MRHILFPLLVSLTLAACSNKEETRSKTTASAPSSAAVAAAPASRHDEGAAVAGAHQDHHPRNGGLVTMEGDNHVEVVVGSDGAIDLYVSDAVRRPIPPKEVSGTITIAARATKEKQTLPLVQDEAKGSLAAKGPAPNETDYTWDLNVRGAPVRTTLTVPAGGTAAFAKPASEHTGDHPHGSPHGGVVQSLAGGHVEVKLDKSGDITLWMLDAAEEPKSAKGVTASLRPVVAGAKEAQLVYDEKANVLRGKIDPIQQDHVDGVLRITPPGESATSLRFTFHLEGHEGPTEQGGHG